MSLPTIIEVAIPGRSYPVVVGDGLTGLLPELFDGVLRGAGGAAPERALVVTQQPVIDAGHVAPIEAALSMLGVDTVRRVVPDGEVAKSVEVVGELWRACAAVPLGRGDVVVAVGGGVVGDLAGFLAATYARGIDVVQVPTTVLAQVDAAIGGKTGINLPEGKNLVGAFHQPRAVVCDVAVLGSLPERIRREGFGEIVKYGLIRDPEVLGWLEAAPGIAGGAGPVPSVASQGAVVGDDEDPGDSGLLRRLVERSVAAKAAVVAADERESGERAYLNLGHTFGHAVESLTGYDTVLHGEAVAIGTVAALRIGVAEGITDVEVAARGEALLTTIGLPTRPPALDRAAVWAAMARDKKASAGAVRFVLLEDVGRPVLHTPSRRTVDEVLDGLMAGAGEQS
ncbi:MAG: 3-dehydroquinate synthase [Nitriliruptor sp.]|nr:MAG: 3-dehydroquinate synthase [Nitriliruptor sp.]